MKSTDDDTLSSDIPPAIVANAIREIHKVNPKVSNAALPMQGARNHAGISAIRIEKPLMKPTDDVAPISECKDEQGRVNHPSHESLSDIWCRSCGVYKRNGVYLKNEGNESLIECLNSIS